MTQLGEPSRREQTQYLMPDFGLELRLVTDGEFLPLGIVDPEGNKVNDEVRFKVTVTGVGIDDWQFWIRKKSDRSTLYTCYSARKLLQEVVVSSTGAPAVPVPEVPHARNWPAGQYTLIWEGFDSAGVYDSEVLTVGEFYAEVAGYAEGAALRASSEPFQFNYAEVEWVSMKTSVYARLIYASLRVNIKDGGAHGVTCTEVPMGLGAGYGESCPWDRVPQAKIVQYGYMPIMKRTRTFEQLKAFALEGIRVHWGRNNSHPEGRSVSINAVSYEVFVDPIDTTERSMDDINLVYNTNGSSIRSGNPGSATPNPASWIGNLAPERIAYNVGYIDYSSWREAADWGYQHELNEDVDFQYTSAHEIGHEILKSFGGTWYSYGHKGSSGVVNQKVEDSEPKYPAKGEIDLMRYYKNYVSVRDQHRVVASEHDVLGLLWLTKLEVRTA